MRILNEIERDFYDHERERVLDEIKTILSKAT